jgi:hypothetical protein
MRGSSNENEESDSDDASRVAVEKVVFASAPEQESEIRALWRQCSHHFSIVEDREGMTLDAGAFGIVRFSHRTMLEFWLLSFASWKAFDAFSAILVLVQLAKGSIELDVDELQRVPGQADSETNYAQAIQSVRDLYQCDRIDEFQWPHGVPQPSADPDLKSNIHVAAYELAAIATGFAFLHESHHVTMAADGIVMPNQAEDELACDRFARQTLLAGVDRYSSQSGYAPAAVLEKRAFGAALNAYFVLVLTPVDSWRGSSSHPPVGERFRQLADDLPSIPESAQFWVLLSSLLIAHLNLEGRLPPKLIANDFKALCYLLFNAIVP